MIYKTTAPGAEVDRILDSTDHTAPRNFQFSDLEPGVYITKIHESADGTTLGNLRHDFWVDAVTNQILLERRFYRVGGSDTYDPAADTIKISDPYFQGKNITGIFQQGNRYLRQDKSEWSINVDGEIEFGVDSIGGVQIKNWADTVWAVEISYIQSDTGGGSQKYGDVVIVTADTTLSAAHWNMNIYGRGASNKLILTAPALASIPENKGFTLVHDGGNSINVVLQLQAGETARFLGGNYNNIKLGIGDWIRCTKKTISGTAYLFVEPGKGHWDQLGLIVMARKVLPNSIRLDGTEYDLSVQLRLADIVNDLPGDQIVPYGNLEGQFDYLATINDEAVYVNHGFFARDLVNNMVKVPDLNNQGVRFLKSGSDSSRVNQTPGGYQHHYVGRHSHSLPRDGGGVLDIQSLVPTSNSDEGISSLSQTGFHNPTGETVMRNTGLIPLMLI
ncbi:hypothetical protein [Paraflavitalea sp. CAU 1676]|uniref:hypothetical protein n=1 Tax=Paraflavitalea sp. CAU 1676 TaxID=3032598 RepID=UPI0023DC488A|nr:hypothetical protein [Paraflavitalea sp. CAU 1676]MDF2189279.1 hypothetical protein [Paraflavitalea sp. CAU 1676]